MKKFYLTAVLSLLTAFNVCAKSLEGEYVGKVTAPDAHFKDNPLTAFQIYQEGDKYKIGIYPDLWRRAPEYTKFEADAKLSKIEFKTEGWLGFSGVITKDGIDGMAEYNVNGVKKTAPMKLKKIDRKSPTLKKKAPEGAVTLIDGKNFNEWTATNGQPIQWEIVGDGSVRVSDKVAKWVDIQSKKKFKDVMLHVEFMTPNERTKPLGQGRGNSGVFIGRFEVQVLDSFGANGVWNECGALYKFMPPQINASLPPEKWQTYDIEYRAPKFENGKMVKKPRITVYLNGMKVQSDIELTENTANGSAYRNISDMRDEPVSIKLQNHENPVRYRNVWAMELK